MSIWLPPTAAEQLEVTLTRWSADDGRKYPAPPPATLILDSSGMAIAESEGPY
jgi:hypothetical protein